MSIQIPAKKEPEKAPEKEYVATPTKVLAYLNPGNKRYVLPNGQSLKTVSGVITPETEEEKELCSYFESIGRLTKK